MRALPFPIEAIIPRFAAPGVRAIALMGSYARDDAGPYSDVDIVRFWLDEIHTPADSETFFIADQLTVVSNVSPAQAEAWFTDPEQATAVIGGLRLAQPLLDPDGYLASLLQRAHAFTWDDAMQQHANRWASAELVGLIEEAHKGLEGLRRDDIGRMLNARFGLSWLLAKVMRVQRGVMLTGDNTFYDQIAQAVGADTAWARLFSQAFGVGLSGNDAPAPSLSEQVIAGLRLYALTATLLGQELSTEDAPLITQTVTVIENTLDAQ